MNEKNKQVIKEISKVPGIEDFLADMASSYANDIGEQKLYAMAGSQENIPVAAFAMSTVFLDLRYTIQSVRERTHIKDH